MLGVRLDSNLGCRGGMFYLCYLYLFTYAGVQHDFRVEGEGNGVKRQYFNYVEAVSWRRKPGYPKKTIDLPQVTDMT